MNKVEALKQLRDREAELRSFGITGLSLFGSVARGEERPDSDVDLVATIDHDRVRALGPFGFFGIEGQITEMIGVKVDLATEPARKPRFQAEIDRDRVVVF